MDDDAFTRVALKRGLVSTEKLRECRDLQRQVRSEGLELTLAELLVQKGYLTPEQVASIQSEKEAPPLTETRFGPEPSIDEIESAVTPRPAAVDLKPPDRKTFGPYATSERIGFGRRGETWKARKQGGEGSAGPTLVLKILPSRFEESADAVAHFKAESKVRTRLAHPNLAPANMFGRIEGRFFYTYPFVEGAATRPGTLDEPRVVEIGGQLAQALAAVHEQGILHGDVRPEKVVIRPDGSVALLPPLPTCLPSGDQSFTAPEAADPNGRIVRSDIFALGATLAALLKGGPVSSSPWVGNLLHRMTAPTPASRPEDAARVLDELRRAGRPAPAPRRGSGRFSRPGRPGTRFGRR